MGRYLGPIDCKLQKYQLYRKNITSKITNSNFNYSTYSLLLHEKQKLKFYYNLLEKQLNKYILRTKVFRFKYPVQGLTLLNILEKKLDSYLVKSLFVKTRKQARNLISYGHIFVNQKQIKRTCFLCNPGDYISINPNSKNIIKIIKNNLREKINLNQNNILICKKTCRIFILKEITPREISFKINDYLILKQYYKK